MRITEILRRFKPIEAKKGINFRQSPHGQEFDLLMEKFTQEARLRGEKPDPSTIRLQAIKAQHHWLND